MAVKKFYLSAAAAAVSPAIPSGYWEDTTSSTALAMTDAPSGTNAAVARAETSTSSAYDVLLRRWVSPPITRAGTLEPDGAGYVVNLVTATQASASAADFRSSFRIFVVASDGTVRGTFIATSGGSAWPTTLTGKLETTPGYLAEPIPVQPGDRVVLEFGYQARNTASTSYTGTIRVGGTATTDLANGDTGTNATTRPPSITFTGANSSDLWSTSTEHQAAATLSGGGAATTDTTQTRAAAATLSGGGGLGAAAAQTHRSGATLSGGGQLSTGAVIDRPAVASLSGGGELTTAATPTRAAAAVLSAGGALAVTAGQVASAMLSGGGQLTTAAQQGHRSAATLTGGGALTTTASQGHRTAAVLSGGGALSTAGTRVQPAAATLSGGGDLTTVGTRVKVAAADLSAGGELGTGPVLRTAVTGAILSGGGQLTARVTSSAGGMLNPSLWAKDPVSGRFVPLPHVLDLKVSDIANDVGAISCEYPAYGMRSDLLRSYVTNDRDLEVEVWTEGRRSTRQVGWLKQRQGDSVAERAVWSFAGVLITNLLAEAIVLPQAADEKKEFRVVSATPGAIMRALVQQAQAAGALAGVTMDFSATHDSSGVAWPEVLTAKWSPGTTLLQVAQRLVELVLAEFTITPDRVLRLWRFGGRGTNRTAGVRPTTFRRGVNLLEAGRRQGVDDAGTDFLVIGGEGQYATATDPAARARRGRVIQRASSIGNVDDAPTLAAAAQRTKTAGVQGVDEQTFALALGVGMPRPGKDLGVGDTVRVDTSGTLTNLRLAQWDVGYGPGGVTAQIVTGDLIRSRAAGLAKRLADQASGETIVGTSQPSQDTGVPRAPGEPVVGSTAVAEGADVYSVVTVGWPAVTSNVDGTAATDIDGYRVEWALQTAPTSWNLGADVDGQRTSGSFTAAPGTPIRVRVQARDRSGNRSAWSTEVAHVTEDDATPPAVASAPTVENYLGTLRIAWNGRTVDGALMTDVAPDFAWCEIHVSQASNFTPDPAPGGTQVGRIYGPGEFVVTDLPYGVTQYVRLVAVDVRGNRQPTPSAQGSATPGKLVNIDLGPDAVARANIQLAAIGTAQVDLLAVNSARISDVEMGKVTAGQIRAAMVLVSGGMISTRANGTGSGWDGDSAGIRLYDPSGQLRVDFKTVNGSALVTGEYRTALTGTRMILNPLGSAPATMQFHPSSSAQFAVMGPLTSQAAGFEGQAGIGLKGFSPRSDQQSGEVTVFPSYAALAWGNERGDGAITTRIAATIGNAFIGGPKLDLSYSPGQQAYIGAAENNAYYTRNRIRIAPRDGAANGNVSIGSDGPQKAYLQFDTQILSVVNDTAFINIQANQCVSVSDRRRKHHIHGLEETHDAAGIVRRAGVYRYRMRDLEPRRGAGGIGGEQIGLMHDELPPEVLVYNADQDTWGVDIYGALAILWHAVKGEMGRQDRTADAVAALERRLGGPRLQSVG